MSSEQYNDLDILRVESACSNAYDDHALAQGVYEPSAHEYTLKGMYERLEYQNNLPAQYLGQQQASFPPVPGSLPPTPMHPSLGPPTPSASDMAEPFFNHYLHGSSGQSVEAVMHTPAPPLEERGPTNQAAFAESQQLIQRLMEQLTARDANSIAYQAAIQAREDELREKDSQIAARDARIQELRSVLQARQNQNGMPSWQHAQTSLRLALGDGHNDFMLTIETLKHLVEQPLQALQVCQALGRIPARERDVLTHHMRYFYQPLRENTWNTWYLNLWKLLRWIGAFAAKTGQPVEVAALHIQHSPARYDNGRLIGFENWSRKEAGKENLKAINRLQGLFLEAWTVAGQSVNFGNRQLDRVEQLVQGCDVQV